MMGNVWDSTYHWECTECGKSEYDADTIITQWLYVVDYDGYLCQSCHQKPKHDGMRWSYLPFYLHCYDCHSPSVKWTDEWVTKKVVKG